VASRDWNPGFYKPGYPGNPAIFLSPIPRVFRASKPGYTDLFFAIITRNLHKKQTPFDYLSMIYCCILPNSLIMQCRPPLCTLKSIRSLLVLTQHESFLAVINILSQTCRPVLIFALAVSQVDGRPPVLTAISQSNGNGQLQIKVLFF